MRATVRLFWLLAVFSFVLSAVYTIWAIFFNTELGATDPAIAGKHSVEWVGTIGLALVGLLCSLIAFYVGRTLAAQGGAELPEDRSDANIDDGEAEQGFFSPWSWWPFLLGISAGLVFLGLAVGTWVCFIGIPFGLISIVGLIYEYHRGYFAH